MKFSYNFKHPAHWNSEHSTIVPYISMPMPRLFFLDMGPDFHIIDRTKEWPLKVKILDWFERKTFRLRVFLNHYYHIFRWKLWKWGQK